MKANGLVRAARGISVNGGDIGWEVEYQRRLRRFNLEVILVASICLAILITVDGDHMVELFPMIAYLQRRRHVLGRHPCQNFAA